MFPGIIDLEANSREVVPVHIFDKRDAAGLLVDSMCDISQDKYGLRKFFGVGVCVAGIILVVFSDVRSSDQAKGSSPLNGDLLVILGSMLYASNVTEEYVIKKSNRVKLMAMLGPFGAIKYT